MGDQILTPWCIKLDAYDTRTGETISVHEMIDRDTLLIIVERGANVYFALAGRRVYINTPTIDVINKAITYHGEILDDPA